MPEIPSSYGQRILVINDFATMRELLQRILAGEGYDVVCVPTLGQPTGVPDIRFDLVITNTRAPDESGQDVIREIHQVFPGVPVLHLDDLTRPLRSALPRGVPSIPMPFSIPALLLAVDHLLQRDSREPERTA